MTDLLCKQVISDMKSSKTTNTTTDEFASYFQKLADDIANLDINSQHFEVDSSMLSKSSKRIKKADKCTTKDPTSSKRLNGYTMFMSATMKKLISDGIVGRTAMINAATQWRELTDADKAEWKKKADDVKTLSNKIDGFSGDELDCSVKQSTSDSE